MIPFSLPLFTTSFPSSDQFVRTDFTESSDAFFNKKKMRGSMIKAYGMRCPVFKQIVVNKEAC